MECAHKPPTPYPPTTTTTTTTHSTYFNCILLSNCSNLTTPRFFLRLVTPVMDVSTWSLMFFIVHVNTSNDIIAVGSWYVEAVSVN